jgi:hypothetical protein
MGAPLMCDGYIFGHLFSIATSGSFSLFLSLCPYAQKIKALLVLLFGGAETIIRELSLYITHIHIRCDG